MARQPDPEAQQAPPQAFELGNGDVLIVEGHRVVLGAGPPAGTIWTMGTSTYTPTYGYVFGQTPVPSQEERSPTEAEAEAMLAEVGRVADRVDKGLVEANKTIDGLLARLASR